jgi:Zinc carboxypeptidase
LHEWDLWQLTRSHVDVYFPDLDVAETELGRLPFRLPPGTSHRIERETRDTSSRTHVHAPSAPAPDETGTTRWDVVSPSNATFHGQYHPLEEIESFVRDLATAHPRQVSIIRLGHSGEGREMFALEITASSVTGASSSALAPLQADGGHVSRDQNAQVVLGKKGKNGSKSGADSRCGFLITGAQHAREVQYFLRPTYPFIRGFLCLVYQLRTE